jgi:hypothetical protein
MRNLLAVGRIAAAEALEKLNKLLHGVSPPKIFPSRRWTHSHAVAPTNSGADTTINVTAAQRAPWCI